MSVVIGISGKINSGKTTISKYLSKELDFNYVSFGEYVRKQAQLLKLPSDRKTLQDLGQKFYETDINQFCENVIYAEGWNRMSNIVIDGIRHINVYEAIKKIVSPLQFYLIYVNADSNVRLKRMGSVDVEIIDSHPTEFDVKTKLLDRADLLIDGALPITQNKTLIINWIRTLET